jgi:anti-anti-sigma factor
MTTEALITTGPSRVVFDFSRLSLIDSAGLAALLNLQKMLARQKRYLVIRSVDANVRSLFEVTGLTEVLNVEPLVQPAPPLRGQGSDGHQLNW